MDTAKTKEECIEFLKNNPSFFLWMKDVVKRWIIYKKSTRFSKHAKRKRIRKKHADRLRRLGL